ncbi:MAG: ABC transporter permease [Acidobacteriota bacterium]|nr:ABC transporter permease [Acidobacteriota bacterium]
MLQSLAQDVRFAVRQLSKRPGFTFTAILVLALGLGANTAIFSLVNAFLLRPLPYKDPGSLTALFERDPVDFPGGDPFNYVAPGNFLDWQKQSTSFEQMAATACDALNLASPSNLFEPQRVDACLSSHTTFSTLGIKPVLGRGFRPDEDRTGAPHVAVISYSLWQRRFGGSPDVIHKQIRLNGENSEIVGVMPRGFAFPYRTVDVWVPLLAQIRPDQQKSHSNHFLLVIGRLRPSVSVSQAKAEIDGFAVRYKRAHPEEFSGRGGNVVALQEYLVHDVRTSLLVLLGAVGCVLIIACVNVANLLLTRAAGRTREIAVREAIGASRGQILRQLLTESVLLALAGAAAGLLLASFIINVLVSRAPDADAVLPPGPVPMDPAVFLFAFGIALAAGLAAGLFPALQSSRTDLANSLKDSTRSATPSRAHGRFRNILVAGEVALSLVLLISAGLLGRSFSRLYGVRPGVRLDHTLMVGLYIPDPTNHGNAKTSALISQLAEAMQHVPGVISAGIVSCPPVLGHCSDDVFNIEGHPLPPGQAMDALNRGADPGFFKAAGIPLLEGRTFTRQDGIGFDAKHPKLGTVVVSESLAKKFFHGEDPVGRYITISFDDEMHRLTGNPVPRYQVVGVVGDVLKHIDAEIQPTFYVPLLDGNYNDVYIVLHTAAEPHSVTAAVRETIHRLEPDLPLFKISTMEEALGRSASDRQFNMLLFGAFAALAVLLAAVGLYGVLSYGVTQRKAEIGIRLALGASSSTVRGLILKQGMFPAAIGIAVGLVAAFSAAQVMKSLLFHVEPLDPVTFLAIPVFLLAVSALACYLPAIRATRIDPTVALRTE